MANGIRITVHTRYSRPRWLLVLLCARLFGTKGRLIGWLWDKLEPVSLKVEDREWELITWAKILESSGKPDLCVLDFEPALQGVIK